MNAGPDARAAALKTAVEELRALGLLALDRLDPLMARLADAAPEAGKDDGGATGDRAPTWSDDQPGPCVESDHSRQARPDGDHLCASCPFCTAVAGLRGERAAALVQVAQHAAGLLAALRTVLAEGGAGDAATTAPEAPGPERVVQRIPVERTPSC